METNELHMQIKLDYRPPEVALPLMRRVRQKFDSVPYDYAAELDAQVTNLLHNKPLAPGSRVAIAAGSRGISHYADIIAGTVRLLKQHGLEPFIVPAMGSHGGATAEGQREVLEHLGITESTCGAPVVASMEVAELGVTAESGVTVYSDLAAYRADAILIVNRVKLHTDFRGPVESGILKMIAIGLGKQRGANSIHKMGVHRFSKLIPEVAGFVIEHAPIYGAIALVEDAFHHICHIETLEPSSIWERERELLQLSKRLQAKIFAPSFDVLVVQEIGKEINGDGMDPNVTGRFSSPGLEGESVIQKVVVLDLSEATEGNACGIGTADMITAKALGKIDFAKTYMNVITATVTNGARLPLIMHSDLDAIRAAAQTCTNVDPQQVRMVMIRNTNCLTEILASEPLCREMAATGLWEVLTPPGHLSFDEDGRLVTAIPD